MKRFWPHVLIVAGLFLLFGGFIYDAIFVGIPYQDPTPELAARYARQAQIASIICKTGFIVFSLGVVSSITQFTIRYSRKGATK